MPQIDTTPEKLRPYSALGLNVNWKDGDKDAMSDCPLCGRESRFGIKVVDGRFNCFKCGESGNVSSFLQWLWKESDEKTADYTELRDSRGLLFPETLMRWGVARSTITDRWIIPGYSPDGKLTQLYRYTKLNGKMKLLATPTLAQKIHGMNLFDSKKPVVFICEGPWDGMALYEMLGHVKYDQDEGDWILTSNKSECMLAEANVIAVPGCNVFQPKWTKLFAGKEVIFCFDNDHPRVHPKTQKDIQPAAMSGLKRMACMLASARKPPDDMSFVRWGPDGYDLELPSGHDVCDILGSGTLKDRLPGLKNLLERIHLLPDEYVSKEAMRTYKGNATNDLDCVPCDNYKDLIMAWRKALKWTEGLDRALSVMLSAVVSTKSIGDQLWVKVIGPAACGKSTLCEAVSVAKRYVLAKSTIRGFHSGFKGKGDDEDNSLIARLNGMTLVTKDGDTLLQSPNLGQILSEARDLYDRTSRTHYRNAMSKNYEGVSMTWLLCGTSSLRSIDSSELGERFLDCVIMDGIDDDLEDQILHRIANRAERNVGVESNGAAVSNYEPEMANVMQLTGGYVEHLRENATEMISAVQMSDVAKHACTRLGKFVAYMRARPSTTQDETAERECAFRLVSQLIRLAKCTAAVMNKTEVDEEVMKRVGAVSFDTARGQVLEIVTYIYENQEEGAEVKATSLHTGYADDKIRIIARFLKRIGVIEQTSVKRGKRATRKVMKLTPSLVRLFEEVSDYCEV